jgi:predicted permease
MAWRPWTVLQRAFFRRDQDDRDLEDELRTHIELETELQLGRGASREEAARAARLALGSLTRTKEDTRAVWVSTGLEQLLQDIRAGSRIITKSPGLTAAVVMLIALVVGGNTTVFSVVHGILTKPAPGVNARDLVTVTFVAPPDRIDPESTYANYVDLASQATAVRLAGSFPERLTLRDGNASHAIWGARVTPDYFETVGVPVALGRGFAADDHTSPARGIVTIISHAAWQAYFQGAADVVGRPILVNGRPATIIGVLADPFRGTYFAPLVDLWVPFVSFSRAIGNQEALIQRSGRGPNVIGRLRLDGSIGEAQVELDGIWNQLKVAYPELREWKPLVLRNSGVAGGDSLLATQGNTFLAIFSVLTVITLLIVCANVANLLIGRAVVRQREMALRQSLGASPGRIVRLLLAEGMAIATLAWGMSLLFAWWVSKSIVPLLGAAIDPAMARLNLSPDWAVGAYALGLAVIGMIAFTVAPALRVWRQPLLQWLKSGEQGIVQGRSRLSTGLVILQLAFSVLLMVTAGLAYRSVTLLGNVDLGYDTRGLLLAGVRTVSTAENREASTALIEQLRERFAAIPGVDAVSYARTAPREFWSTDRVGVDGLQEPVSSEINVVGPDYLAAYGLLPVAGSDVPKTQRSAVSAVVTRSLAAALWPGQSPLGRTLRLERSKQSAEVVGVAPDAFFGGYRRSTSPRIVLMAAREVPEILGETTFHIRHTRTLDSIAPEIHRQVRSVDPGVPIVSIRSLDAQLSSILLPIHLITGLLTLFGVGSLLIAAIGQYAAVSFDARRRVREVGVRMALGASSRQVLASVLGDGFRSTATGLTIGFLLSLALATLLRGVLYGVTPTDAVTYGGVFGLLALASLVACYVPARRASQINPIRALRHE